MPPHAGCKRKLQSVELQAKHDMRVPECRIAQQGAASGSQAKQQQTQAGTLRRPSRKRLGPQKHGRQADNQSRKQVAALLRAVHQLKIRGGLRSGLKTSLLFIVVFFAIWTALADGIATSACLLALQHRT